jgi:hypothetical protein
MTFSQSDLEEMQMIDETMRMEGSIMYAVNCHNEFCSGPEHFANIDTLPKKGIKCPNCGWLALPGSGIKKVVARACRCDETNYKTQGDEGGVNENT